MGGLFHSKVQPGQVPGSATNDNAPAGDVGEVVSASVALGSGVGLISGTAANVASISLTPGDWDVFGDCTFTLAAGTVITQGVASISTVTGTTANVPFQFSARVWTTAGGALGGNNETVWVGPTRISIAVATTIYLVAESNFTTAGLTVWGGIRARRVR